MAGQSVLASGSSDSKASANEDDGTMTESITPDESPEAQTDAGKLKQLLGILRKVVGVKVLFSCLGVFA